MLITITATALVIAGVVLAGLLDQWSGVPLPLGLSYLGIAVLLLSTVGVVPAAVAVVTAVGVVLVLLPGSPRPLLRAVRDRERPLLARARSWVSAAFVFRWFDLSVAAVVIVGALDVAAARPILGGGSDLPIDVLLFGGLLYSLIVRPGRMACGLVFLVSAACALIQLTGQPSSRVETLLASAVQISLAVALAHLRAIESRRLADRPEVADAREEQDALPRDSVSREAGPR